MAEARCRCRHTRCGGAEVQALREFAPDLVVLRPCGRGHEGLCTLGAPHGNGHSPEYIVLCNQNDLETAVLAIQLGAVEVLRMSEAEAELPGAIRRAMERRRSRAAAAPGPLPRESGAELGLIGNSPAMVRVWSLLVHVAPTSANVLLYGETGTGKELAARAIHRLSPRSAGPLVPVSCAALPEHLLESELFGHRRGSFTGAVTDSPGLLERAAGGTVILDEVETLTHGMQAKLLRAVEERTIQRVGGRHDIPVDFRLVAATNEDLAQRVEAGSFREDLYYRLSVFPIEMPPLRFRRTDIPALVAHFSAELAAEAGVAVPEVPQCTMNRLMDHTWPGNVRELKHWVERAFIMHREGEAFDIAAPLGDPNHECRALETCLGRGWDLGRMEEEYIRAAIRRTGGHRNRAAQMLGIDRRTLYRKLRRIGVEP